MREIPVHVARRHGCRRRFPLVVVGGLLAVTVFPAGVRAADAASSAADRLEQSDRKPLRPARLPPGAVTGPVIPGLDSHAVPQGLAYLPDRDWFLISLYRETPRRSSFIVAVDAATEKLVRCMSLQDEDGRPHAGHVGGIAIDSKWVWIGSGDVYRMPVAVFDGGSDTATIAKVFTASGTASFVASHDETLWVGEFVTAKEAKKRRSKGKGIQDEDGQAGESVVACLAGYALDDEGTPSATTHHHGRLVPDAILSLPEKAQGVAFHEHAVLVSTSHGRTNDSELWVMHNPLARDRPPPHAHVRLGDRDVGLWLLDGLRLKLPCMAEGIAVRRDRLAIVFESGAMKYREKATETLDRLVFMPLDALCPLGRSRSP